jgi:hypothetical protein
MRFVIDLNNAGRFTGVSPTTMAPTWRSPLPATTRQPRPAALRQTYACMRGRRRSLRTTRCS